MNDTKDIIRVICCGNPFRGDDGAGMEVFRRLEKEPFSPDVEIIEGGIRGINLLPLFNGCRGIIFVDSVLTNETPGRILWFTLAQILKTPPVRISIHETNPAQLMTLWNRLNRDAVSPRVFLLGIAVSEPLSLSGSLSPEIRQGAKTAVFEIKQKIRSLTTHETC